MDGFGDDFIPKENVEVDPAAEFLAREQNDLAGLDDDITGTQGNVPEIIATPEANGGAILEQNLNLQDLNITENDQSGTGNDDGLAGKQSNYDIPELMNGATDDTDLDTLRREGMTPSPVPVREEPEKIKMWREEQQKRLEEKDVAEEKEKEELRLKAKQELEDWYKQHEEQITKTRQANRSAEKDLVADTSRMEPGTEWERIAKLCDFNPKTAKCSRDISRMRSIILQVKQNPPVKA